MKLSDDTKFFNLVKSMWICDKIQQDILRDWAAGWQMKFSLDTITVMHMSRNSQTSHMC